jgi:hypothetical protein
MNVASFATASTATVSRLVRVALPAFVCVALPAWANVTDAQLRECYDKRLPKDARECFDLLLQLRDLFVGPPQPDATGVAKPLHTSEDIARLERTRRAASHAIKLRNVMTDNLDPSYVTVGSGLHLGGDKTARGMLYEAQLSHNFSWFEWPAVPEGNEEGRFNVWLDVPIRIAVRQLTDASKPVRTPSYNPGMRLMFARNTADDNLGDATYFSLGAHHYSNGQEAESAPTVSRANTVNGSFNTNYVEAALHRHIAASPFPWTRIAFRQDFFGTWETIQNRQFPKRQLSAQTRYRNVDIGPLAASFSLTGVYRFGYEFVTRPGLDLANRPLSGEPVRARDRIQTTIDAWLEPIKGPFKGFSLYARYDWGYDYYNINFQNRINRMQFGVVVR